MSKRLGKHDLRRPFARPPFGVSFCILASTVWFAVFMFGAKAQSKYPGSVDETFQCNALALHPGPTYVTAVSELADGKLLVLGSVLNVSPTAVARLNPDGSVDTSFPPARIDGIVAVMHAMTDGK